MSNAGQAVLSIGGAIVGFIATGGNPAGAAWGFQLGGLAGSALFPTDLGTISGPRLNDLNIQTSTVGAPIPIVYGTYAIAGNLIWSSGIIETVKKKRQGGKGGPTQTVKTFSYKVNCAVGICEGEIGCISRVWADSKLIYDSRPQQDGESGADYERRALASTEFRGRVEFYFGAENQDPDPTIELYEGAGNVSGFRGLAYAVFTDFQLEDYGNRTPNFRFEVTASGGQFIDVELPGQETTITYTFLWSSASLFGLESWIGTDAVARWEEAAEIESENLVFPPGGYYGPRTWICNNSDSFGCRGWSVTWQTFTAGGSVYSNNSGGFSRAAEQYIEQITTPGLATPVCSFSGVALSTVIADLCARCGLAGDQIDVSDLTELVDGYVITRPMSARDAISPMRSYGWFDCIESDGVLKWPTRGKAEVFDLKVNDLAAHAAGDSRPSSVETDRQQTVELPRRLRVHYAQTGQNYEPGEQSASRLAAGNVEVRDLEIAVAMSDTKGAQIADVVLYDLWVTRNSHRFAVDHSWLKIEPGDAGTAPIDGRQERVRVISIDHALPGLLRLECVRDDDGVYQSYAIGAPAASVGTDGGTISIVGTPDLVLLDLPLLRDEDNDAGYYAAIGAVDSTTFGGAVLYRSSDGGATYTEVAVAGIEATLGEVVTPLGTGPTTIIDEGGELEVTITSGGDLESISDASLLAGLNAAAIGADGRWEIIQFRDAALSGSPPTWRLTGLLRGRRGTEWAVGTGVAGDRFVLLDAAIVRVPMNIAGIGAEREHKAVLVGASIDAATAVDFTGEGAALEPFSVVDVTGERSGGDLVISWIRRGRIGAELAGSGVDIPLSEETEAYEIDVIVSGSPDVVRTLTSSTTSVTYTEAQQAADFGSPPPADITVRIYQMSATVGRGYPTEATL
jgi:hypothetical protein